MLGVVETSISPSRNWAQESLSPSCQGWQMEGWQSLLGSVQFPEHGLNTSWHWGWGCEAEAGPRPGPLRLNDSAHILLM